MNTERINIQYLEKYADDLSKYTHCVTILSNQRKGKKHMLKTVGLILNRQNEKAVKCAEKAAAYFGMNGVRAFDPQMENEESVPDLIVTFGGDGTLLIGARYAMEFDIPLIGINLGTVGFLTEEDPDHLEKAVRAIVSGQYQTETRSLLRVVNCGTGECFYALNDAVITRGGYARLIRVDAFVNGKEYAAFTADGIIAATPTGSTGYSLSAGGPIVDPGMNCMIITPVCPHSMHHCPCVVPEDAEIRFLLHPDREQTAELQIDGQNRGSLRAGPRLNKKSRKNVPGFRARCVRRRRCLRDFIR